MDFSQVKKVVIPEGEAVQISKGSTVLWTKPTTTMYGVYIKNNTKNSEPTVSIQESFASVTFTDLLGDGQTVTSTTATPYGQFQEYEWNKPFRIPALTISKGQCEWSTSEWLGIRIYRRNADGSLKRMYSTTVQTYKDARLYVDAPEYGNKLYIEVDDGGWHSIIDGKLHVRAINITYRYE